MSAAAALAAAAALTFTVQEGGNVNVFHQSADTAYHLRVANPENPRLLAAFPAGNSGVLLSFDASVPENKGLAWTLEDAGPWAGPGGLRGAQAALKADRSSLVLTRAILDSMRLIRYPARHALLVQQRRELAAALGLEARGWADNDDAVDGSTLRLSRHTLDGTNHYQAELAFGTGATIERRADGSYRIASGDGKPLRLRLSAGMDYKPLTPIALEELLQPKALEVYRKAPESSAARQALDRMRFLVYGEKWLAGSHRFLTYFGRDTMITALMAWEQLTPQAREAALRSVLDRLSPEGVVAHEEDIGGQAELRRVEQALEAVKAGDKEKAKHALENSQDPIYDYKMIDGEPLLAVLAHRFLTDPALPASRRQTLLSTHSAQGPEYRAMLERALKRLAQDALPYARKPKPQNLIPFRHPTVGDWRDSNEGNGFGKYSASVNAFLVPRALAVMKETAAAAGIDARRLSDEPLDSMAKAWAGVPALFKVSLSAQEARARLERFLARTAPADRAYYERRLGALDKLGPVEFTAVSLDADGKPIPVMTSDALQALLAGGVAADELPRLLGPLEKPFPLGLSTEVGVVCANPAFSDRPKDFELFSRTGYHGAAIWGWQQNALMVGAAKAGAAQTVERERAAVARAGQQANLELWTFEPGADGARAAAFNLGSGGDSEPNPAQLWSSVRPEPFLPR